MRKLALIAVIAGLLANIAISPVSAAVPLKTLQAGKYFQITYPATFQLVPSGCQDIPVQFKVKTPPQNDYLAVIVYDLNSGATPLGFGILYKSPGMAAVAHEKPYPKSGTGYIKICRSSWTSKDGTFNEGAYPGVFGLGTVSAKISPAIDTISMWQSAQGSQTTNPSPTPSQSALAPQTIPIFKRAPSLNLNWDKAAHAGDTLSVFNQVTGADPITLSYQWSRCTRPVMSNESFTLGSCQPVLGATGSSYVLQTSDNGYYYFVTVQAQNSKGQATSWSNSVGFFD